jgi:hypothetical protein
VWDNTKKLFGLGATDCGTTCILQVSAMEFRVPAVPEFTVALSSSMGESTTAEEIITGVPALVVVPEALVTSTVVVVEATIGRDTPLFPVAPPVYPERVTAAPAQALDPAPDSAAASV